MASVNKVILVGNLGRDPETRHLPSGDAVTNVAIATTEQWKDKNGDKQESTEWHRVAFFGRVAEVAGEYLKKGSQVYIEGRLQTRKWTDKDGQERFTTEIRADRLQMLGGGARGRDDDDDDRKPRGRDRNDDRGSRDDRGARTEKKSSKFDDLEDDIPF